MDRKASAVNTPKTWTQEEIIELIEREIRETSLDFRSRGKSANAYDLATAVYLELADKYLVEFTP